MGRPSNTAERRAQIVDAFVAVVAREGFVAATTARIASAAGLSPGLVHYHFADMEEILVAAVEVLITRIDARAQSRLGAAARRTARGQLHAYVDAHVALGPGADAGALSAWVALGAEATRHTGLRKTYARAVRGWFQRVRDLVHAALREERRTTRNAPSIAAALVSAIDGAFHLGVASPGLLPKGYAAPALRRMVDALLDAERMDGATARTREGSAKKPRPTKRMRST